MDAQVLRIGVDIEIISCLIAGSSLIISAGIADIIKHQPANVKHQKTDNFSLVGVYDDFCLVANEQIHQAKSLLKPSEKTSFIEKIIKGYYGLVAIFLPIVLTYITYVAIRFHFAFLAGVTWASLCGFMLLAITATRNLNLSRKLRLILINPVIFIPFVALTIYWAIKIASPFMKTTAIFFMQAKVMP